MPKVPPSARQLLVAIAAAVTVLSACTSSPTVASSPSTSATSSSPSATSPGVPSTSTSSPATPSSPVTPSSSAAPSTSAPATSPTTDADAVTLDISIADGQVSPNGSKVNVTRGQTVVLRVTSDTDDEIHAHTGNDGYELAVTAGKPATGRFLASEAGRFEVESHHLEKIIAILVVR